MTVGPLLVIGGAEDKTGRGAILSRFVRLAGGAKATVAVIATASALGEEIVEAYREVFTKLGVAVVLAPRPTTRTEADDPALVEQLDRATGIFMTGGNQTKLSAVVTGTAFGEAIKAAHARGTVVAGTSAGASVQSEHMVAFGREGSTPKFRMSHLSAGLGLLQGVVVDQHFSQRNRYGRLLTLVCHSPHLLGLGVDEDTAGLVTDGHILEVLGRGAITVFDGDAMTSNVDTASGTAPLLASGVVLHSLPAGARFDLTTRRLLPGAGGEPDDLRAPAAQPRVRKRLDQLIATEGVLGDLPRSRSRKKAIQPPP